MKNLKVGHRLQLLKTEGYYPAPRPYGYIHVSWHMHMCLVKQSVGIGSW